MGTGCPAPTANIFSGWMAKVPLRNLGRCCAAVIWADALGLYSSIWAGLDSLPALGGLGRVDATTAAAEAA